MSVTYKERCAVCDVLGRKNEPRRYGVFNIVDREREQDGVLRWEAPLSVLKQIMKYQEWHERKKVEDMDYDGRYRLFDEYNEIRKIMEQGRDLNIIYNPDREPWEKYKVKLSEVRILGSEDQIKLWHGMMDDLMLKELYPPEEYALVEIEISDLKEVREPGWNGQKANKKESKKKLGDGLERE